MKPWEKDLNIQSALDKVCGDKELIIILMQKFYEKYNNVTTILSKGLQQNQFVEMHLIVHSIKGLLGNVGAENSSDIAKALESKLKNSDLNYEQEWIAFKIMINNVMASIKDYLDSES